MKPELLYTVQTDWWREPMAFALCSDGIYKYCPEEFLKKQIFRILKSKDAKPCMGETPNMIFQNRAWGDLSLIIVMLENKPAG